MKKMEKRRRRRRTMRMREVVEARRMRTLGRILRSKRRLEVEMRRTAVERVAVTASEAAASVTAAEAAAAEAAAAVTAAEAAAAVIAAE
jgi:hypothetical protein